MPMAHAERAAESSAKWKAAGRKIVLVGAFREDTIRRVNEEMVSSLGVAPVVVPRCEETPEALTAIDPVAILVRTDAPGAEQAYAHLRGQARFAQVPLFGVPEERNDLAFTEVFSWGGDDLVSLSSPQALARRLRPLLSRAAPSGEWRAAQGMAIVAGGDARWRSVMGRALHNGGFVVRFVTSAEDLEKESAAEGVRLVVAVEDLGAVAAVAAVRARGSEAAWVVVAPPKKMAATHAAVAALPRVSVADGYAPPENVLFLANELLNQRGVDKRASPRLLYGTAVAFRAAGRDEDEIGFSYNVNAGGVYVRTLAPLDAGQDVWLEMWPPRSERRVRLCGKVAWKRAYGPQERATVPAGFGVQITDGLGGDLDRWRAGYDAFAQSLFGTREAR
jgi:Tfp pilus assembly protein PilZ